MLLASVKYSSLRPDMVLTSEASKQIILLELAVPWEDHLVKVVQEENQAQCCCLKSPEAMVGKEEVSSLL